MSVVVKKNPTFKDDEVKTNTGWQLYVLIFLFLSVIFVAIKTVVHRHESRTLFMSLQILEKERDRLAAQWSRLKLEQGTLLNQVNVERQARRDLKMKPPKASDIKIVREVIKIKESPVIGEMGSKVALGD